MFHKQQNVIEMKSIIFDFSRSLFISALVLDQIP